MQAENAFWALPGPARFVSDVVGQVLVTRRGMVGIRLPVAERTPDGLLEAVRDALLDRGGGRVVRIRAGDGLLRHSIAHGLAYAAGIRDSSLRTVAALAASPDVSATTFLVEGMEAADWPRWAGFLRGWSAASAEIDRTLAPTLAVCLPIGVPDQDAARLFEAPPIVWRGRVSPLDMRSHVGILRGHDGTETLLERVAAEVIVRVALWDPSVAAGFAPVDARSLVDLDSMVKAAEQHRQDVHPTWENGLIDLWDGKPTHHLVACSGRAGASEIKTRVWAAMAQHVLPFVTDVIACFVERYRSILVDLLPIKVPINRGQLLVDVPEKLEISSLWRLLGGKIPLNESEFLRLVADMRNAVAHHQVVPAKDLAFASNAWTRLGSERGTMLGWSWPRCGQRLEFVRDGSPIDAVKGTDGSAALVRRIHARLAAGRDAVVDARAMTTEEIERIAAGIPVDFEVVKPAAMPAS